VGSKHALSNGNEPEEVTDLVAAFEQHNKCKIVLSCSLELHNGYLDLDWSAVAVSPAPAGQDPTGLVLASAKVWGGGYRTLKGLLSQLLYALDYRLAEKEFDKAIIK
jgi:hypothetical protein